MPGRRAWYTNLRDDPLNRQVQLEQFVAGSPLIEVEDPTLHDG